ncbi:MAG TPA: hypothetical protein VJH21_02260 [Candidatus Paceibacterota bacterium]
MIVLDISEIIKLPLPRNKVTGGFDALYIHDGYIEDALVGREAMEAFEYFHYYTVQESSGLSDQENTIFLSLAIYVPSDEFEVKSAAVFIWENTSGGMEDEDDDWSCRVFSSVDLSGIQQALFLWGKLHLKHNVKKDNMESH